LANMVWLPDHIWKKQQQSKKTWGGQGKGGSPALATVLQLLTKAKGSGKSFGKGGKGKPLNKYQEKLKKTDSSKLVWVGGLSSKTTWKSLESHFATVLKPSVSDIVAKKDKITAILAYKSAEDVATVVAALNGTELDGSVLEVDAWQKAEKPEGEEKKKHKKKSKVNTKFAKAPKKDQKTIEKLKAIEPACKAFVGGLAKKTTWKSLEKHFSSVVKPKIADVNEKTGKGVVAFTNEADVLTVISALNGSELDGNTIEVDVWTRPEKKEKVKKEKAD